LFLGCSLSSCSCCLALTLAGQLGLLVPSLGELLNLHLPFGSELFLGRFRLVGLLQLGLLLGELLGRGVTLLLQLVELGLGARRSAWPARPEPARELLNLGLPFGSELFLGRFRLVGLLQLGLLLGDLLGRCVAFLLQLVELGLALAGQLGLLVPSLGELLNLHLPFGSELFLGRFRLVGLLQLGFCSASFLACSSLFWSNCFNCAC
jgi:hypothetical protein